MSVTQICDDTTSEWGELKKAASVIRTGSAADGILMQWVKRTRLLESEADPPARWQYGSLFGLESTWCCSKRERRTPPADSLCVWLAQRSCDSIGRSFRARKAFA